MKNVSMNEYEVKYYSNIVCYVIKDLKDNQYLTYDTPDCWTDDLDQAEAFENYEDAVDKLDDVIRELASEVYPGDTDEDAEKRLDWDDENRRYFKVIPLYADKLHESKLTEEGPERVWEIIDNYLDKNQGASYREVFDFLVDKKGIHPEYVEYCLEPYSFEESKMKESENWYDDMKAEKSKKEGAFIDTLQKKHPELKFESQDDIYFAYGVYDTDNNYLGKILLDTHYEFIPKRDCPEEIIKLFKKEGFGINLNVSKPWKESKMKEAFTLEVFDKNGKVIDHQDGFKSSSEARGFISYNDDHYPEGYKYTIKMKEAFTKNENEITFPGEDLHSKLCEWVYSTADYYDLQDACEVGENPEEMTWNMSDKELVEAIIYTLNNQEEIWYMYTDDDPETSTARKDGEDLVKEYKYRARQMGRSNCDEWKVKGRLEKRNESNEYFHKERDGVYVARKVRDQKGFEDYADWQKEYLGSKRRARWVNSPLYAKRFRNEEEAQKYLDTYGKDDYYESKIKESYDQCTSCGRDLDIEDAYTSRITGDALCQDCYDDEAEWIRSYRKNESKVKDVDVSVDFPISVNNKGRVSSRDAKKLLKHLAGKQMLKSGNQYFVKDSDGKSTCWFFIKSMDPYFAYEFSCEVADEGIDDSGERDYYNCLYIPKSKGKLDLKNAEWESYKV